MTLTLFDPPPAVAGSATSAAAARSVLADVDSLRARVLAFIRGAGGATCDEVEAATGMRHQTASARCRDLAKAGLIRDSGRVRPTRSGRAAVVWEENIPEDRL